MVPDPNQARPIQLPNGEVWPYTVFLKAVIKHSNISIGDYSYYNEFSDIDDFARHIAPYLHPGSPEKLSIGKFCQLGHGTKFITSSANHQMDGISTFPFAVFGGDFAKSYQPRFPFCGDTVIGHDVWFGHNSLIMPGVTIGSGAIIGAGSVVTKDVAPYTVVAGNPAKLIRSRFDELQVKRLLDLGWWDWPIDMITNSIAQIVAGDVKALESCHF